MSDNNMYDILGKLASLNPAPAKTTKPTQPVYESVEARGSILSGVGRVEAALNEKYMGFKAVEKAAKKGGADDPAAVAASIGRKKYGKTAFQKAAASGKKMGEGDMGEGNEFSGELAKARAEHRDSFEVDGKKYQVKENGLQRYTGIKKYGKEGFEALQKAGREGAGEEEKGRIKDRYLKKESMEEETCMECGMYESQCGCDHSMSESWEDMIKHSRELSDKIDTKKKETGKSSSKTGHDVDRSQPGVVKATKKADKSVTEHMADGDPTPGEVDEKAPPGAKAERMVKHIKKSLSKDGHLSNKDKAIAYATTWKAHNKGVVEGKLTEGINFSDMVKETDGHVSEMLGEIQKDIQTFKTTGQLSDKLEAFLKVHHHGKKQLQDAVRPEDIPAVHRKQAGQNFPVTMDQVTDVSDKMSHSANLRPQPKPTMDAELNELAKLAGVHMDEASVTAEGNALTGKLAHTHKGEEFEVGGKQYTNTSSLASKEVDEEVADEGNAFTGKLKDTNKGDEFELDGKKYKDTSNLDESMTPEEDKISISTNMSTDGEKNVSVNANGSKAAELLQMLKLAGLGSDHEDHGCEVCGQTPCACGDEEHGEPEIIAISGDEHVDEAEAEYANVPHEEYQPVDTIIHQGADLNREKSQHPFAAAKGDNPMESFDPIEEMGRRLMREYNSIKIQK